MDLESFLVTETYRILLVFCRVGTAFMFMPGFGEMMIPSRIRLLVALVLSAAVAASIPGAPSALPEDLGGFVGDILVEVFVGFWIGAVARILLSALHTLGHKIGYVSALSNAMAGGGTFENSSIFSSFLTIVAITVIFMADVHHIAIGGLVRSYDLIPLGDLPPVGDFADQGVRAASTALTMSFRFAAPFLILAIIINAGMGLANRMMPSLPVYFVATPLLVAVGITVLLLSVAGVMLIFTDTYADWLFGLRL